MNSMSHVVLVGAAIVAYFHIESCLFALFVSYARNLHICVMENSGFNFILKCFMFASNTVRHRRIDAVLVFSKYFLRYHRFLC